MLIHINLGLNVLTKTIVALPERGVVVVLMISVVGPEGNEVVVLLTAVVGGPFSAKIKCLHNLQRFLT